ncbi:MAG: heat-inducible transcription repressor HrcA [Oscillospiraceae bacterium]|nr:heat-inducible transcription repressor HrcA [Oscillospiraceae bacterium]
MELSSRKKQILKVVVEDYIETAEPVGSKVIAAQMEGKISSATIRNELADLVEMGYLEQPHTSAGRIPSPKGYRLYVNELMEKHALSVAETEKINEALHIKMAELDDVISQAGQMMSLLVQYPTYMMAGGKGAETLQRAELLFVDENSIIVVLMVSGSRVKSKLLKSDLPITAEQLPALSELLNRHFTGIGAAELGHRLMDLSGSVPPELFLLLSAVVSYATEILEEAGKQEVITAGTNRLLKLPEYRDVDKAHELMSFLDSKKNLPIPAAGAPVEILIGPENVDQALKDSSVVVASYDIGDNMKGLIGVVGPTRMDYASVAARLSYFAEGLTKMFGKNELPAKKETKDE